MYSVIIFIKYIHFVSVHYNVALTSYHLPPRLVVCVESWLVALGHEADNVSPAWGPIRAACDHQVTGLEEVLHCFAGISVW